MGLNLPELSLDLCPGIDNFKTISEFFTEISTIQNVTDKNSKLQDYVQRLEDEMKKIDAFKRELPLCMLLLNDAIVKLKEEAMRRTESKVLVEMEEFIPLKGKFDEDKRVKSGNEINDKKNWMSSAQLWSTSTNYDPPNIQQDSITQLKQRSEEEDGSASSENPCKYRNRGGAFMPFKENSSIQTKVVMKEDKNEVPTVLPVPGLSLMPPMAELVLKNANSKSNDVLKARSSSFLLTSQTKIHTKPQQQQQQQQHGFRKQRRCWSQELHRCFVNALQQLGGTQVATPKQIRELMQVDGLTNDEVKSHLQKYRLHIRKLPDHNATAAANNVCNKQDQSGNMSKPKNSQSNSPKGPFHIDGSATKDMSTTRGSGDSIEEDEDDKSDGHSWKGSCRFPINPPSFL